MDVQLKNYQKSNGICWQTSNAIRWQRWHTDTVILTVTVWAVLIQPPTQPNLPPPTSSSSSSPHSPLPQFFLLNLFLVLLPLPPPDSSSPWLLLPIYAVSSDPIRPEISAIIFFYGSVASSPARSESVCLSVCLCVCLCVCLSSQMNI